jgi:hypothetical protein
MVKNRNGGGQPGTKVVERQRQSILIHIVQMSIGRYQQTDSLQGTLGDDNAVIVLFDWEQAPHPQHQAEVFGIFGPKRFGQRNHVPLGQHEVLGKLRKFLPPFVRRILDGEIKLHENSRRCGQGITLSGASLQEANHFADAGSQVQ